MKIYNLKATPVASVKELKDEQRPKAKQIVLGTDAHLRGLSSGSQDRSRCCGGGGKLSQRGGAVVLRPEATGASRASGLGLRGGAVGLLAVSKAQSPWGGMLRLCG